MFLFAAWILALGLLLAYSRMLDQAGVRLSGKRPLGYGLAALTLGLIITPLASGICSRLGWHQAAVLLHYFAFFCFGTFVFGAFLAAPALVAGKILLRSGRNLSLWVIMALILVPALGGGVITGYGIWQSRSLGIKHTTLASAKIPAGSKPIRIAAIADLHLENPVKMGLLKEMTAKIAAQKPDLILALGDIVVGKIAEEARLIRVLAQLQAPLGKYFIYGNHEMLRFREQPIWLLQRAGFRPLVNQAVNLGEVNLIGLTDSMQDGYPEESLPGVVENGKFTILMKHRPLAPALSRPFFDLQLSGHTHGGQIWPMHVLMAKRYPHLNGLYALGPGKWLYTSPGAGTHGPPLRIGASPEITIIDLVSE